MSRLEICIEGVMCIRGVKTFQLLLVIFPLLIFTKNAYAALPPMCVEDPFGEGCGGIGGGGGGGGSPLTIKLKNDALDRELAPWSCTIDTARNALRDYLESIEGTAESLNLEPLTTSDIGSTIDTASFLELQSELQTPWSDQVKSFHYVYKQLADIAGEDPVIVNQSHVSFLVKCDATTGDTRLTSLRGKYFGSQGLRSEFITKFNPSGFSRNDAINLGLAQLESCESTIGAPYFFALPGQTRLVEAVELTTTTDGEICGSPPIPVGRRIIVTATEGVFIFDDTSGVGPDITGEVKGYVMLSGPYTGNEFALYEAPLAELDVEAYNGSNCFEDLTDATGDYIITDPTGSLSCNFRLPREYQTSSCGLPRGEIIQLKDDLGSILSDSLACSAGDNVDYTFNAPGSDRERYTPQTNVYYHTLKAKKWLSDLLSPGDIITLNSQTVKAYVNTNDGDCHAEHQFGARTMHFSEQGAKCYNMAFDSPIYHEYGHFVDNIFGQVERSNNVEMAMSEGWGDIFSSYIRGDGYIASGMYKDFQNDGFYLRNLHDPIKWFDPACLGEVAPGSICGVDNNEPCDCNPDAAAQDCSDLGTAEEILECRRYHYGQVWASMIFKLRDRIAGENAGDPDYVNRLMISALTSDVQTIEDGLSKIINSDIPSSRTLLTEPPHLCTFQGVARDYGFNLELIPELENFDDCFLKTYHPGSPEDEILSMFNTLVRASDGNFYVSGFARPGVNYSDYFQVKINEQGERISGFDNNLLVNPYPGYNHRGKAALDIGSKYFVVGLAGSPDNLPGGSIYTAEINNTSGNIIGSANIYGTVPDDPLAPQVLDMAQSLQPINGGAGGYIISGITQTYADGPQENCMPDGWPGFNGCGDAFIGYLDSSLNPESGPKPFNMQVLGGIHSDIFHDAKQITSGTHAGDLIIAGSLVTGSSRDGVLLRIGVRGALNDDNSYYTGVPGDEIYRDVAEVMNGGNQEGFIAVGFTQEANKNEALLVTRIDEDLTTPAWSYVYDTPSVPINEEKATSIMQFADQSGFLVAGTSSSNVVLMKLDNDGNTLWCKKYLNFENDIQGPNLALTSDGTGFLIAGQHPDAETGVRSAAVMRITLDGDAPTKIVSCNYNPVPPGAAAPRQSGRMGRVR